MCLGELNIFHRALCDCDTQLWVRGRCLPGVLTPHIHAGHKDLAQCYLGCPRSQCSCFLSITFHRKQPRLHPAYSRAKGEVWWLPAHGTSREVRGTHGWRSTALWPPQPWQSHPKAALQWFSFSLLYTSGKKSTAEDSPAKPIAWQGMPKRDLFFYALLSLQPKHSSDPKQRWKKNQTEVPESPQVLCYSILPARHPAAVHGDHFMQLVLPLISLWHGLRIPFPNETCSNWPSSSSQRSPDRVPAANTKLNPIFLK